MRLTEEQYADLMRKRSAPAAAPATKKSKFKNIRCQSADGKNFASRYGIDVQLVRSL
jgi:hypothetical protein